MDDTGRSVISVGNVASQPAIFDYRGHGQSGGRRGHIFRFEEYLEDFRAFIAYARECNDSKLPVFIFAHSYGGLITECAHIEKVPGIAGAVLSSPFLRLCHQTPQVESPRRAIDGATFRALPCRRILTHGRSAMIRYDP